MEQSPREEMRIRAAGPDEYETVRAFYHSLIDAMKNAEYKPGWEKDVYPANDFLRESLANGDLFVGEKGGKIIAAMILNHDCNESYGDYTWPGKTDPAKITVIHALGVHPEQAGKGFAKELVRYAIDYAQTTRQEVIRLDVLAGNVPAEKLYPSMGFTFMHRLKMFYEDTGWADFELYELILPGRSPEQ